MYGSMHRKNRSIYQLYSICWMLWLYLVSALLCLTTITHHKRKVSMRIEIHAGKFSLTESLRKHIERRIQFTLSWAQQGLQKVVLRLDDINGPKGGADKSCRVQ